MDNSKKATLLNDLINTISRKPKPIPQRTTQMTRVADSALAYISGAKNSGLEVYVKWSKAT